MIGRDGGQPVRPVVYGTLLARGLPGRQARRSAAGRRTGAGAGQAHPRRGPASLTASEEQSIAKHSEDDFKILGVTADDPRLDRIQKLESVAPEVLTEIVNVF